MNQQTLNGASDVSARIGALELGAINSFDDSTLEAAHSVFAGPTMPGSLGCRPYADSELEVSIQVGPGPSGLTRFPTCMPRIDDGALEAFVQAGPPPTMPPMCRFIDDGALEASIQVGPGPTLPPMCYRIDDGALEATLKAGPSTMPPACRFIDDNALEQASARADVGPTVQRIAGHCY